MIAARLHKYHEALAVEQIPEPEITGPHDVIVRIGGAGLCRTDLHVQEGQWAEKSGVAAALRPRPRERRLGPRDRLAVTNVAVGDTVILHPLVTCGLCRACRAGDDVHCTNNTFPGISTDGGFAELLKTTARSVVKLDPSLHPKDIAALADAGLTAYHAVKKAATILYPGSTRRRHRRRRAGPHRDPVPEGDDAGRDHRHRPVRARAGAGRRDRRGHHTVAADGKQVDTILEMTDGLGAEAIIDFVGERGVIPEGVAMLRQAGSYYVIGYGENVNVPTIDIISREINFIGNLVGSYNDLAELMTLTAQGKVSLHTSGYPLDAVNDAMADLDQGRLQGRGILVADAA